ncbi:RRQRL motif-containing zinc-binding protein [Nocardiopsis sp. CNT312]|uniref:RRQRL motif-containing zinc-binding protein n=1 Tax=Nocardiopsis sp. CNT312 TaxID=1137268 RepID=UPI00048C7F46|nr:RRQRL motif-containing zinc-binding protein [Nocardiopsis sp. CNT312]
MTNLRFLDPDGSRYGLPTYPWGTAWVADDDLATRKQLSAMGLRPGTSEPVAQLMWRSRKAKNGVRTAALYRISEARPKEEFTEARARGLAAAMRARRTCPTCRLVFVYVIPTSLGECPACHEGGTPEDWELEAAA